MKDPYEVLGVSKTASFIEIKKAYRNLAKKHHPDLNPGSKTESEKRFKEIQFAYDLIGTPEAKSRFDRGEMDEKEHPQYNESMHRARGPSFHETQQNGGRYSSAFSQGFNAEDIFDSLFSHSKTEDLSHEDELYQMDIEFKEAAIGGEKVITLPSGKKLQVKIPAGIEEGQKLKFKGLASSGGNAYVQIRIIPLEGFAREGNDILTELPISFFEAISGAEISVATIDGRVMLRVLPGVSTGTKLRIRNKGIGSEKFRGNQIVIIKVVMPKEISDGLREAICAIEKKFTYNPRLTL